MLQINSPLHKAAFYGLLCVFVLLFIFGCNPYKKLENRPPLTAKDSAALLARCIKVSPLDTTISHYLPLPPLPPDSSAYFKAILDTLDKVRVLVRDSILIKYKDTCTSAIRIYQEAFNIGKGMGEYDARMEAQAIYRRSYRTTDSLNRLAMAKLKSDYNLRLIAAANSEGTAKAEAEKYRKKYERLVKWTWGLSVAFLLAVIICILLWKFKRQARAANNVVNDVRNLK